MSRDSIPMRSRRTALALAALLTTLVAWAGCGSTNRYAGLGSEGDYLRGEELYLRGRCFQAVEALEAFLAEHPGSARVDDAIIPEFGSGMICVAFIHVILLDPVIYLARLFCRQFFPLFFKGLDP